MRHVIALAALPLLLSCSDASSATRVILTIDAQDGVRARTDHTHVTISSLVNGVATVVRDDGAAPGIATFPYKIELTPASDDATRSYRVEVSALDHGTLFASASVSSGYVAHQTRYLALTLEDSCVGKPSCGTDMTCHLGACIDARVVPDSLPLQPVADNTIDSGARDAAVSPPVLSGDAAVSDAMSVTPPGSDAQLSNPPPADAQVGTDASAMHGGTDDGPCAGEHTGTYDGTLIPDNIKLLPSCEFQYNTPSCASDGTYSKLSGATGALTLTVNTASSGVYQDNQGNIYSCLPPGSYACQYSFAGNDFTYECNGQPAVTYVRQ